jgi:glycosyltransferase involved in cell wall biosynthesis
VRAGSSSLKKKHVLVAIASDIATDVRVTKVVRFLLGQDFLVCVICCKRSNIIWGEDFRALRMNLLVRSSIFFYVLFNLRLFLYGLFKRSDIILANDLDTLPACRMLGWLKRVPVIYDSHEFFTESVGLMNRPLVKGIWKRIERFFLPGVAAAYTVSEPIAKAYSDRYSIQFSVIRNYPDLSQFPSRADVSPYSKSKYILYQGVFNPFRSLPELIRSMLMINEDYHLILAGYGELEVELKEMVHSLGLENRVLFTGTLGYTDLIQYTYHASLGIALEEADALSFRYSLPNKVFDYVAAGLPFLSMGTPLVRQLIDDHGIGFVCESNLPEYLANKINQVLADTSRLDEVRSAQNKVRSSFNWQNECLRLRDLFGNLR